MPTTAIGPCPYSCPHCGRRCHGTFGPYSHRFDCCAQISAHDVVARGKNLAWQSFSNPTRAGYLTGPSTTLQGAPDEH
jgi:hypothetical protein